MKLATFKTLNGGAPTVGGVQDDVYIELAGFGGGDIPPTIRAFLEAGSAAMEGARKALARADAALKTGGPETVKSADGKRCAYGAGEIELLSPVPRPGKIIHTACNFDAHLEELTTWQAPKWRVPISLRNLTARSRWPSSSGAQILV